MVVGDTHFLEKKIRGMNLSKDLTARCMMLMALCVLVWRYMHAVASGGGETTCEVSTCLLPCFRSCTFLVSAALQSTPG